MSVIIIVGAAVVLLAIMCGFAMWWDSKRDESVRLRGSARQRAGARVQSPFKSRRRAVAATLQVATAQLPPTAPGLTVRPSEQGNFFKRIVRPIASGIAGTAGRLSPCRI